MEIANQKVFIFGGYVVDELLIMHDVPVDTYSYFFVMYNFAACGTLMIFWTEFGCGDRPPLGFRRRPGGVGGVSRAQLEESARSRPGKNPSPVNASSASGASLI